MSIRKRCGREAEPSRELGMSRPIDREGQPPVGSPRWLPRRMGRKPVVPLESAFDLGGCQPGGKRPPADFPACGVPRQPVVGETDRNGGVKAEADDSREPLPACRLDVAQQDQQGGREKRKQIAVEKK